MLINTLRSHTFNAHKFNTHSLVLSLWEPFTHTLRVVSKWIHVHLRQLAHVKISYLRTNNKWTEETYFRQNPRLATFAPLCLYQSYILDNPDAVANCKQMKSWYWLIGIEVWFIYKYAQWQRKIKLENLKSKSCNNNF